MANKNFIKAVANSFKERNIILQKRLKTPRCPQFVYHNGTNLLSDRRPGTGIAKRPLTITRQNTDLGKFYRKDNGIPNRVLNKNLTEGKPELIENYDIGIPIGHGAYAMVKTSTDKTTGKVIAVKVYEKYKLISSQRKNCINREIRVLKMINHPNIVKLHEVIETSSEVFLFMELVRGKSLLNYMKTKQSRRVTETEAINIFKQILSAIAYCHKRSIIHRDIKMDNILLDENMNPKIIDFGFSTWVLPSQKLKIFCGTPSYMAPEIVGKKEYYGPPVDMWSLGILLYAMICGHFPFRGSTEPELYRKISKGLFAFPTHVSGLGKNLISGLLAIDPRRRLTAEQALDDPFFDP